MYYVKDSERSFLIFLIVFWVQFHRQFNVQKQLLRHFKIISIFWIQIQIFKGILNYPYSHMWNVPIQSVIFECFYLVCDCKMLPFSRKTCWNNCHIIFLTEKYTHNHWSVSTKRGTNYHFPSALLPSKSAPINRQTKSRFIVIAAWMHCTINYVSLHTVYFRIFLSSIISN